MPAVPPGAYRRYALVYDLVWAAAPYDRFVDLCLEAAAAQGTAVRRVLVAACGTGNAAVELAGRGYEVTGFDLSLDMLAVAAAKPGRGSGDRRVSPASGWSPGGSAGTGGVATWARCPGDAGPTWSSASTRASTTCEPPRCGRPAHLGRTPPTAARCGRAALGGSCHDGWAGRHSTATASSWTHLRVGATCGGRLRWTLGGVEASETTASAYADASWEAWSTGRPRWSSGGRCGRRSRARPVAARLGARPTGRAPCAVPGRGWE